MIASSILISPQWQVLELDECTGLSLIVGASDTGKSTFARYLYRRLHCSEKKVAVIDGDPGQSTLGPPTTLTLTFNPDAADENSNDTSQRWRYFIGSTTPQGHMLPMLVGAARLAQVALQLGAQAVIYDTCGLVEPRRGGLALKNAKLDLLQPATVFALRRQTELEPFLLALRRSGRARLIELMPSEAVVHRDVDVRREHRKRQFAAYFAAAQELEINWNRLAVMPYPAFGIHRLLAFEDLAGFTIGLGIVLTIDRSTQRVRALTPLRSLTEVAVLRIGDLLVHPDTFQDEQIMR